MSQSSYSKHFRKIPYSSLTFFWIGLFGWKELLQRSPITLSSLPNAPRSFDANYLSNRFNLIWNKKNGDYPNLWISLLYIFRISLCYLAVVGIAFLSLYFASIFILIWLINAIENVQLYNKVHLVCIAMLLTVSTVGQSILRNTLEYGFNIIGMKYRILLTTAIYQKIMSMSYIQVQMLSVGSILTIVTSDLYKFDIFFNNTPYIVISPIGIALIAGITSIEFGWISILIVIFFIIHITVELSLGAVIYLLYQRALKYCDKRNKCMREFIEGFRLIKCFAWEYAVAETIQKIRKKELLTILTNFFLKSVANTFSISFPLLYIFSLFLSIYVLTGGELTSSRVFGFLAFMTMYYGLFQQFNRAISDLSEVCVSMNRVNKILRYPPRKNLCLEQNRDSVNEIQIEVDNLSAGWKNERDKTEICIEDISICLKRGESLSVIGKVGAGKSSLLLALLNELEVMKGDINLLGSCALVPEEPWILSTSIRDNITYGRKWNCVWYGQVVSSCCLEVDFGQFRDGDLTIIGERGITLSGGQKARISLARAIYYNADIYLLDDPLSSVDAEVAKCLFSVFRDGILSNKTVILVTHQLQFAKQTDQILLLDSGKQLLCGKYSEIRNVPAFNEYSQIMHNLTSTPDNRANQTGKHSNYSENEESVLNTTIESSETVTHYNGISLLTYARFIWTGGKLLGVASLLFSLVPYFSIIVGTNYYLVWWIMAQQIQSNSTAANSTHSFNPLLSLSSYQRVYTFVSLCLVISVLMLAAALTFSWIPVVSSYRLHRTLLWKVLRAPSTFYYKNSTGSIINRFSKDTFTMEHILPYMYLHFLNEFYLILFSAISAFLAHWLTIIPNLFLLVFLILFRFQLVRTIRQIKRIESAAKSDVISHVSLSLHGITSIHSLSLEQHQSNKMCELENIHSKCWRVFFAFSRSFSIQLDMIIAIYSLSIAVILIILREQLSPVVSAFVLTQIFNLLDMSQYTLRISAELEMHMVSVERVLDYIGMPQEAPLALKGFNFHVTKGDIEFRDVQLRYSPDLPLALRGVSFRVRAGERLGIVGRTGAGKTSLQTALLRLVEISSGQIAIDGVDIASVGLHELRGEISIIPQDPVLFSGTLRFALDPFSSFQDEQLWQALREVQLCDKVEQLEGQLSFPVSEGGSNFSVGERQLLCLARAILKRAKILMLDEATSNVDSITDNIIQHVLSNKFRNCTLLTIAHRINSIIDYDRILLMDSGQVVECDTPQNLLDNPNSKFAQLVGNMKI